MKFHECDPSCAEILGDSWLLGASGKILRREDSIPSVEEAIVVGVGISGSWVNTRQFFPTV